MSTTHTLNIKNESQSFGNFCVFQDYSNQYKNDYYNPLVWISKAVQPHAELLFTWNTDYSMALVETCVLKQGTLLIVSQSMHIDPNNPKTNSLVLSKEKNLFLLKYAQHPGPIGMLSIKADATIPSNRISVGIEMDGKPTTIIKLIPSTFYQFSIRPTYWVAFGDFKEGETLDFDRIRNNMKMKLPSNFCKLNIAFTKNKQWKIID